MSKIQKDTKKYLTKLVVGYMEHNMMFTSLDIANQAKSAGHSVRNYQVAAWMRKNVITIAHSHTYLYNQQLISVDSKQIGMTLAYLYLPYDMDPDEYLDRDQNPKSFQTFKTQNDITTKDKKKKKKNKKQSSSDFWKSQQRGPDGRWM